MVFDGFVVAVVAAVVAAVVDDVAVDDDVAVGVGGAFFVAIRRTPSGGA